MLIAAERLTPEGTRLAYVRYLDDFPAYQITNVWSDPGGIQVAPTLRYMWFKQTLPLSKRCLLMTTDPGDLVLDPTCGSGTTAYVAEQWGRRWITIDTSRVALALARTRLMSARYPYYLLADCARGRQEGGRNHRSHATRSTSTENDIRKGFVYKRVPHVTLKSIANNPEIDSIHAKWQEQAGADPREAERAPWSILGGVAGPPVPRPDPLPRGGRETLARPCGRGW